MTHEELRSWIHTQQWYQTIELSGGLVTPGRVDSRLRYRFLEAIDVKGRRVLDIGCNSGAYSLWAKRHGAAEVVGVDISDTRLDQARQLAQHEGLDVTFLRRSILELPELGRFDVVLCFAVLTEVPDLLGALGAIRALVGQVGLIELALARPLFYLSRSRIMGKGFKALSGKNTLLELRKHKNGWSLIPTIEVVTSVLGPELEVIDRGPSVRYRMLEVRRNPSPT